MAHPTDNSTEATPQGAVSDDDFEEWADEQVRQFEEFEADRFACGGWRCAGASVPF